MLTDNFGRPVKSMRIQVNTSCNLKCFFCHMEGTPVQMQKISPEQIEMAVMTASRHGVNRIKFTGGEPLMRKDIVEIVERTRKHITGDISMTTNGFLLPAYANKLRKAGLDRINISMHSIDPDGFRFITGTDGLDKVQSGISAARKEGFSPIKVNFVVLKGINVGQIERMIEFCAENNAVLQLIEYETTRGNEESENYVKYHEDLRYLQEDFEERSVSRKYNDLHDRPRYTIPTRHGYVDVELVMPMRNWHFCNNCTRIRLTSTGELKACLMRSDLKVDVSRILESSDYQALDDSFISAVKMREPYWREEDEDQRSLLCQD